MTDPYIWFEPKAEATNVNIPDGDYVLTDGAGWFALKGFAVRIRSTNEGIAIDVYPNGDEMRDPLASWDFYETDLREDA